MEKNRGYNILLDTNFTLECSSQHLTRSLRSLLRIESSLKAKFASLEKYWRFLVICIINKYKL